MMVMFAWGRLRHDLVALAGLMAAVLLGIVPHDKAFTGFSDDIVIIVAGALVVSATVSRSGISRVREDLTGERFSMFDFAPVGARLAVAGALFPAFGYRLLPHGRKGQASIDAAFNLEGYTTEVVVPEGSTPVDKSVGDLKRLFENEVDVLTVIRDGSRRYDPPDRAIFEVDDILLLQRAPDILERIVGEIGLKLCARREGGQYATRRDQRRGGRSSPPSRCWSTARPCRCGSMSVFG